MPIDNLKNDSRTNIKRRIAVVAHDNKKKDLLEWAKFNKD